MTAHHFSDDHPAAGAAKAAGVGCPKRLRACKSPEGVHALVSQAPERTPLDQEPTGLKSLGGAGCEGADVAKAEQWARTNEAQLRAELVSEQHVACGMAREIFVGGRVREVRGPDGEPVRGAVQVIESASFEAVV